MEFFRNPKFNFLGLKWIFVSLSIAAVLLFSFGTGPVKGFALTLVIGLAASMFTAVYVSRLMFQAIMGEGRRVDKLSI